MRADGLLGDRCDGTLFPKDPFGLQLLIYFEVVNPIGAHRGIGLLILGVFFFFFFFFQGNHTLSRKKWSENHHTVELDA